MVSRSITSMLGQNKCVLRSLLINRSTVVCEGIVLPRCSSYPLLDESIFEMSIQNGKSSNNYLFFVISFFVCRLSGDGHNVKL